MNYTRLTFQDRKTIERYLRVGTSQSEIARVIGVHRSTVSNEVKRNGQGVFYSAYEAQRLADARAQRNFSAARHKKKMHPIAQADCYFSLRTEDQFLADLRYGRLRKRTDHRKRKIRYEWTPSFKAEIFRQWYLNKRNRDHVNEGKLRGHRSLHDWQRYRKTNWAVIRKALFTACYKRSYMHAHLGIVKGLYRSRGWWSERGMEKEGKNYPHVRYPFSGVPIPVYGKLVSKIAYRETNSVFLSVRYGLNKTLRICLAYFCAANVKAGFSMQNFLSGNTFLDYVFQYSNAVYNLRNYPILFQAKKLQIIF